MNDSGRSTQEYLCLATRLVRIPGQHALVEALDGGEGGPIAQDYVQELQPLDVPPQNNQA
jgi:hypothetical protein